jgi:PEP-utilizing family enzyme/Hsp20/alpha crystallin family protein
VAVMRAVGYHPLPPHARVREAETEYVVEFDVADFTGAELTVEVLGPVVTVRGEQIETEADSGLSRDDAEGKFLTRYLEDGVLARDPFVTLDQSGVGALMPVAVERGRSVNPSLTIGICGEHGGDPDSVKFCHGLGLDYVSCSPYRVTVARLAAAQGALAERGTAAYVAGGG